MQHQIEGVCEIDGHPGCQLFVGDESDALECKDELFEVVLIEEEGWDATLEPTHLVIMLTSGKYEAFVGKEGNVLWVDNVSLVYED